MDGRLLPKERVVTVSIGQAHAAFPFTILAEEGVVNYRVGDKDLVVFFKAGTRSALDASSIASSQALRAWRMCRRERSRARVRGQRSARTPIHFRTCESPVSPSRARA